MYAVLINILVSLLAGVIGGVLVCFTLRTRVWRLEHEQAHFQVQLTREVKSRASSERWAGEKISTQVLKDMAALQAGKNASPEVSREDLRLGRGPQR